MEWNIVNIKCECFFVGNGGCVILIVFRIVLHLLLARQLYI